MQTIKPLLDVVNGYSVAQELAFRNAILADQNFLSRPLGDSGFRLQRSLAGMLAGVKSACLLTTGDSTAMSTYPPNVHASFYDIYGFRGVWLQVSDGGSGFYGLDTFLPGGTLSGATTITNAWTKSLNGCIINLSASGQRLGFTLPVSLFAGAVNQPIDKATIVYYKSPGAGTFKLQTLRAQGGINTDTYWQDVPSGTINTDAAAGIGSFEVAFPVREVGVRVRALWVSGSCDIVGCLLEDTTAFGFTAGSIGKGGTFTAELNLIATADMAAILNVIKPDLITYAQKESVVPATAGAEINATLTKWMTAYPTDIVALDCFPGSSNSSAAANRALADAMTAGALAAGCWFFDSTKIVPDYDTAVAYGMMQDAVHRNALGATFIGSIFWNALGFPMLASPYGRTSKLSVDAPALAIAGVNQLTRNRQMIQSGRLQLPYVRIPASTTSAVMNGASRSTLGTGNFTAVALFRIPSSTVTSTVITLRNATSGGNEASAAKVYVTSTKLVIDRRNDANTVTHRWEAELPSDFWQRPGQLVLIGIRRNASPAAGVSPLSAIVGDKIIPMYSADLDGTEIYTGVFAGVGDWTNSASTVDLDFFGFSLYTSALTDAQLLSHSRTLEASPGADLTIALSEGNGTPRLSLFVGSPTWINRTLGVGALREITGSVALVSGDDAVINSPSTVRTVTLPAAPSMGDVVRVSNKGAAKGKIGQPANTTIIETDGSAGHVTTSGTGGSLAFIEQYGTVTLECITASGGTYVWLVIAGRGTYTWA